MPAATSTLGPPVARDWMNIGAEFTGEEHRGRERVEEQIAALTWTDVPQDGSPVSVAFMPGEAIKAAIAELRLPKVQRIAINGYLQWPDGPETAHFSIYGIECLYRDYRVRLYVLDSGTGLTPLAADRWHR